MWVARGLFSCARHSHSGRSELSDKVSSSGRTNRLTSMPCSRWKARSIGLIVTNILIGNLYKALFRLLLHHLV